MPLEPIRVFRKWLTGSRASEPPWNELSAKAAAYAGRTNANLKQLGLDLAGFNYEYSNSGATRYSTPIDARVSVLENYPIVGPRGIGLNLANPGSITIVRDDGSALTSTNTATVTMNSTSHPGQIITRTLEAPLTLTLTGAHWGFGTTGDRTGQRLFLYLIDTGSTTLLGIGTTDVRSTVTTADAETAATDVTSVEKVLVSGSVSAESACLCIGYVLADFDDTGNPAGEDYWSFQSGIGDVTLLPLNPRRKQTATLIYSSSATPFSNRQSLGVAYDGTWNDPKYVLPKSGRIVSLGAHIRWTSSAGTSQVEFDIGAKSSTTGTFRQTYTDTATNPTYRSILVHYSVPHGWYRVNAGSSVQFQVERTVLSGAGALILVPCAYIEVELDPW